MGEDEVLRLLGVAERRACRSSLAADGVLFKVGQLLVSAQPESPLKVNDLRTGGPYKDLSCGNPGEVELRRQIVRALSAFSALDGQANGHDVSANRHGLGIHVSGVGVVAIVSVAVLVGSQVVSPFVRLLSGQQVAYAANPPRHKV